MMDWCFSLEMSLAFKEVGFNKIDFTFKRKAVHESHSASLVC